jgi:hypothetical protein
VQAALWQQSQLAGDGGVMGAINLQHDPARTTQRVREREQLIHQLKYVSSRRFLVDEVIGLHCRMFKHHVHIDFWLTHALPTVFFCLTMS